MTDLYLGTSGWSYKEWIEVFYPSKETNKLSFYSRYFRTAEIDSTFYAYPSRGMMFGCARYTPPEFSFSVKLPRLITHEKRLNTELGVKEDLIRFLDLLKPLMETDKLGPLLIQLPPSFAETNGFTKLRSFFGILPTDIRFAVEFRHPSWLKGEVWDLLKRFNIANTIVDEPLLPPEVNVTSDLAFVRWHGRGARPWYNYRYTANELKPWLPRVREITKRAKKTYGYFNNHFHGFAVENSLMALEMLGKASSDQKEMLRRVSAYIDSKMKPLAQRESKGGLLDYILERGG